MVLLFLYITICLTSLRSPTVSSHSNTTERLSSEGERQSREVPSYLRATPASLRKHGQRQVPNRCPRRSAQIHPSQRTADFDLNTAVPYPRLPHLPAEVRAPANGCQGRMRFLRIHRCCRGRTSILMAQEGCSRPPRDPRDIPPQAPTPVPRISSLSSCRHQPRLCPGAEIRDRHF